jgi:hypothetical protein
VQNSSDFFLADRVIPDWVCGLAFLSADLAAQKSFEKYYPGHAFGSVPEAVFTTLIFEGRQFKTGR